MISQPFLKDAERVTRITMIAILLTAGTSKLLSNGGFFDYYSGLFQGELRIVLPARLVNSYLALIPHIEIGLGLSLIVNRWKWYALHARFLFMLSLTIGYYLLQEWSAVNRMLDYFFLGILCPVLPRHDPWLKRDDAAHT